MLRGQILLKFHVARVKKWQRTSGDAVSLQHVGVSNGPIQFKIARKIWLLLELLAKIR